MGQQRPVNRRQQCTTGSREGAGATERPPAGATVAALILLPVLLSHSGWASAEERCTKHSDCEVGEFCGKHNSTGNATSCLLCSTMCSTPSAPTSSTCNLPCAAVDGDCCTQQFKMSCQARQVIYTGPVIPCSVCDSATVAVQTKAEPVQATLQPTVQMLRDLEAGLPPKTETFPCENFDETLVGNVTLRCAQTADSPTLEGSAQDCARRIYEATEGFRYSQDPSWQDDAPDPETECGGISLVSGFNPLISVGIDGVGRCHSTDTFESWGREQFVGPDWVDGEHERWGSFCVDCDVETGYEGGTATLRLYRGTGCSPLSQSRLTHLTVDQCAISPDRQVRYTATCDVNSFSQCPKPDGVAVQVSTHRSVNPQRAATCASEPELLHAFAAENVGMDQCIFISRNNTATVMAYRSLRVCCSASMIRIRYYTDPVCSVRGDSGDEVEYSRGCNSITGDGSETLDHVEAVCSSRIPSHHCPPLNDVARATIVDSADTSDEQTGTTLTAVGVIVVIAAVAAAAAAAGLIAAKSCGWNYRKTLFGESSTVAVEKVIQPKEKTEKQKIFEQYRAMSNDDAEKRTGIGLSPTSDAKNMPSLPGSITFDDDADDPLAAAKMATEAAAEDSTHTSRSKNREHKNAVRSASHHDKRKRTDNGKVRSKSFAPRTSHSQTKEQRKSGSEGSRRKEQLQSASEGGRRKAVQHNLTEMKNLEGSKQKVGSDSHRGESTDKGKMRSNSFAQPTSHSRKKEHLRSASESGRRKAGQHNLKEMKNPERLKREIGSDSHRGDSVVTCRALFDRTCASDRFNHLN